MDPLSAPPAPRGRRLLIPVDPREHSRWGVRHALDRAQAGETIEVYLLYIVPPSGQGDLLRFRNERDEAENSLRRADIFLEEAAVHLLVAGVPCRKFVREGDPVQGIQDFAEQEACAEIVLPNVHRFDWFSGSLGRSSLGRKLKELDMAIPVVLVRADGSVEDDPA